MTPRSMTLDKPKEVKELQLVALHESLLWDEDDPRGQFMGRVQSSPYSSRDEVYFDIDMGRDSYIWVYTGTRGAGKTTVMTLDSIKAAYLYGKRILSNYPIECLINKIDGTVQHVKAETLDLYRLLCFDSEYTNCLIVLDEAPDIISHMSSMTWKNRLINIFTRQLRKNRNSLFLGAQQMELIDKSLRWQVDIVAECQDASRKYGWGSSRRGEEILLRLKDNSGMWTGETYNDAIRESINAARMTGGLFENPADDYRIFPRALWGDETHKPVFDTYYQQDVFESLRKVDMKLGNYQIGGKDDGADKYPVSAKTLSNALDKITTLVETNPGEANIYQKGFYSVLGSLTDADKNNLGKLLSDFNIERGGDGTKRWYGFGSFDLNGFRNYVTMRVQNQA